MIEQHGNWATELAERRNPAAHRVPLYVSSSVLTSQAQVDDFKCIEAQADVAPSERGDRRISEIYREAQAVGDFVPLMFISTPQGWKFCSIHEQVWYDHEKYLTLARAVVNGL